MLMFFFSANIFTVKAVTFCIWESIGKSGGISACKSISITDIPYGITKKSDNKRMFSSLLNRFNFKGLHATFTRKIKILDGVSTALYHRIYVL